MMDFSDEPVDVIETSEIDHDVSTFKVSKLEHIGTFKWFEKTIKVSKLYRVAVAESLQEQQCTERVKSALTNHSKCDHVVRELVTMRVWKDYVLKKLLTLKPEPTTAFPTYMVLYYEVMVHGIIQSVIFHGDAFNYLTESVADLVEYCVHRIRQLVHPPRYVKKKEIHEDTEPLVEIKDQHRYINFNIGSQCIATLRYVCENLEFLPLSVSTRIYSTHDLPVLVTQLLDQNVWTKVADGKTYKFNETEWQEVRDDDPPLTKMECQVWLLLRQMLLGAKTAYHYSDYRKAALTKLLRHLNDQVLDQLSVLVDLQRMLSFLQVRAPAEGDKVVHVPLIVEVTPLYYEQLVARYSSNWGDLALASSAILFYPDKQQTATLTQVFSNSIKFLMTSEELHSCQRCMKRATNRCSRCKRTWYCSRSCQVQHWKIHKPTCVQSS